MNLLGTALRNSPRRSFTNVTYKYYDELYDMVTEGNKALHKTHGKKYDVGCGSCILYAAPGVAMDWMADKAKIK